MHGAKADGSVAYRRKLSRGKLLGFLASQPGCTVAMEACASAHYWGRQILALGHEVRLVPPIYVKPFVKRHKNDAADAEAITEAAQRPTMHFVAVKTEAQQAQGMLFRTRDLLVRQRTQTINALRGCYRPCKTSQMWPSKSAHFRARGAEAVGGWIRGWRVLRDGLGNLASPLNGGGAVIGREKRMLLRHYLERGVQVR